MKLLIVTQVIDIEHPILGFFHRWIEEFAKHCEQVHVICLQEGKHSLPENVSVYSLGKEEGKGRLTYLWRFYTLIWKLRHEYDNVFVHMNQIYVILGALLWRILGKKVGLWYAHGTVTLSLQLATLLSDNIFTSTPEGMRIETSKRVIVGQGIDVDKFVVDAKSSSNTTRLITVGRISRSKNIDTLLQACSLLKKDGKKFTFRIIGSPTTSEEFEYANEMYALTNKLMLDEQVEWVGPVPQRVLPAELQQADVFIHDGSTNSLDKTLLEAVLCGCVVVSSNPAYRNLGESLVPGLIYKPKDATTLANIIESLLHRSTTERKILMKPIIEFVRSNYSVTNLISGIVKSY